MRQAYALLGLVNKWGAERVDAACASALEHEAINVGLIGRMLERATENARPAPPPQPGVVVAARFARDPGEFATRRAKGGAR
jgi:hypothetical protein